MTHDSIAVSITAAITAALPVLYAVLCAVGGIALLLIVKRRIVPYRRRRALAPLRDSKRH